MNAHGLPEAFRKRAREDEYADIAAGGTLGFTEHRSKRLLQALPTRLSPKSRQWTDPAAFPPANPSFPAHAAPRTITPGDSDSEEMAPAQQHTWADEPELPTHHTQMISEVFDQDMDMMDTSDQTPAQPQVQNHQLQGQLAVVHITGGRIPTPIHCSFAQQVRGNNWNGNGAQGELQARDLNAMAYDNNLAMGAYQSTALVGQECVPRSFEGPAAQAHVMADWNMVQNRRLPSPISENGGEDGNLNSPHMVLDSSARPQSRLDHLTHEHPLLSTLPARCSSAGAIRPDHERTPSAENPGANAMDIESPATPSPRRGHQRSKHTLNSWTSLAPGMKRSFSIGYRPDCDMCRDRVPGHFNHLIIS